MTDLKVRAGSQRSIQPQSDEPNIHFNIGTFPDISASFRPTDYYLAISHLFLGTLGIIRESRRRQIRQGAANAESIGVVAIPDMLPICPLFLAFIHLGLNAFIGLRRAIVMKMRECLCDLIVMEMRGDFRKLRVAGNGSGSRRG